MSDELDAVTESTKALQEVAKTAGKGLDLAEAGGRYLAWMLGTTPQDVVGLLGGDYLRQRQIQNWCRTSEKILEELMTRGVEHPAPLNTAESYARIRNV